MKVLSRLNSLKVQSAKMIVNPYKGEALKTFERLTDGQVDSYGRPSYSFYKILYNKEANKLFYITDRDYLHILFLEPFRSRVGFFDSLLTTKNTFKPPEKHLWCIDSTEFTDVLKTQADANKFYENVIKEITGMDVSSTSSWNAVGECIEEIFESYRKS